MKYPVLKPTQNNKFILMEEYKYHGCIVPAGYQTNGADVPRLFWFIVPPFKPKFLPAVMLHDYFCDIEEYELADFLFKKALFEIEKSITTKIMVKSVKIYHKLKYGV